MKYGAILVAIVALVNLCTSSRAQGDVRVGANLEKLDVGLGEHVRLMVSIEHAADVAVEWPVDLGLGPHVEERNREVLATERHEDGMRSRATFTIAVYELSVTNIPGIAVTLRHLGGAREVVVTPVLAITIDAVVDLADAKLRPSRAPTNAPVRDWKLLYIGLAICLLLVVLASAIWMMRRKTTSRPAIASAPVEPPHEEALRALDAIEDSGRLDGDDLKTVFHDMSEVMRAYLGRRFLFQALDQTSSEIRSRLKNCQGNHEWGESVNHWLGRCDLVKYAGASVTADQTRAALHGARVLIDRTKEAALRQARPVEVARA